MGTAEAQAARQADRGEPRAGGWTGCRQRSRRDWSSVETEREAGRDREIREPERVDRATHTD